MTEGIAKPSWDGASRRRAERFDLKAPLDVTILRSGIPDTVPGRTVDASENGLAAMLAGEVTPGETVGIQVQLPTMAGPLRTRAKVKYQDKLRCGLEFLWLSEEERSAIRDSAQGRKSTSAAVVSPAADTVEKPTADKQKTEKEKKTDKSGEERAENQGEKTMKSSSSGDDDGGSSINPEKKSSGQRWGWILAGVVFMMVAIAAGVLWWKWQRGWQELESSRKNAQAAAVDKPQAQVAAEVMEKLLVHRVEPVYPAEARRTNVQGVIALDIVIGRDGTIATMRPLNGPDMLARAAMDALRWWRFEPYRINGEPAVVETTVAVEFKR
jgi:TonB family protein